MCCMDLQTVFLNRYVSWNCLMIVKLWCLNCLPNHLDLEYDEGLVVHCRHVHACGYHSKKVKKKWCIFSYIYYIYKADCWLVCWFSVGLIQLSACSVINANLQGRSVTQNGYLHAMKVMECLAAHFLFVLRWS